jgi:hypothetical protein
MPKGSMQKYFADQGGQGSEHGGKIHWPGTADGFPFRGPAPDLKQQEFADVPLALDYHSREFRLAVPDDKAEFDLVMDRIVNGWYMQHKRDDGRDEGGGRIVWLEWVQIYGETPGTKHPGVGHGTTVNARPVIRDQRVTPEGRPSGKFGISY